MKPDYAEISQYLLIYTRLIPEEWISQIHSLLNLNLQTLIAKKKKIFKRVKIDIITYLYVEFKFCRRFQDSNPQIWSQEKIKKDIIFIDYCRFVVRERNLFRERKWEVCIWREEEREIRRERESQREQYVERERVRESNT